MQSEAEGEVLACSRLSVVGTREKKVSERKNEGGLRRGTRSTSSVIFEGLKRTTLRYGANAYDVTTAMLVSLNNEKSITLPYRRLKSTAYRCHLVLKLTADQELVFD